MSDTQQNLSPGQDDGPKLALEDISNLLITVDLASQRGAFRANELSQIGQLFDRVNAFLNTIRPATTATEPQAQPTPPQPLIHPPTMPTPVMPQPVMPQNAMPQPMSPPFAPKVGM